MRKLFFISVILFLFIQLYTFQSLLAQDDFSYTYHSDFTQYPPGSDGSPEWLTYSTGWEIQEDALWATDIQRNFAVLSPAPYGKLHSTEVIVNLQQATGNEWKTAGVIVYQNAENYWHFALVEEPDNMGKKHFVELVEMVQGNWLSQIQKPTALTLMESRGGNFRWQYNHPYRMKLQMTPERITGILEELDGAVRAKLSYRLNNRLAVTFGKPGLDNGGFQAAFRQFSTRVGREVKYDPGYRNHPGLSKPGIHCRQRDRHRLFPCPKNQGYLVGH